MINPNNVGTINNSKFVLILFFGGFLFQITVLKYIWGLENIARIFNIFILITSGYYAIYSLLNAHVSRNIWFQYLLPGNLILGGMLLNIIVNAASNYNLVSKFVLILPWIMFLIIPHLIKRKTINIYSLWRYSYYFMLVFVI